MIHIQNHKAELLKTLILVCNFLLNISILTLAIRGGFHTACSLAQCVSEVDVPFCHDGLMKSGKLADHLRHRLLQ